MKHVVLTLWWYDRLLHEGVAEYAAEKGWFLDPCLLRVRGNLPRNWHGQGIITNHWGPGGEMGEFITRSDVPTVVVQSRRSSLWYPLVATDPPKTAALAFEHLRHVKGFRHFGVYGSPGSDRIGEFVSLVESQGAPCPFLTATHRDLSDEVDRICSWIHANPSPIAVYCNNDDVAIRLVHVATAAGIDVPNELAVIGTDNDVLACNSISLPVSSVDTNLHEVGRQAAALLDRMMDGDMPPGEPTLIPPLKVVERASTNALAAGNPHVRKAVALMRRTFADGITITDIVAEADISHDGLKKAFLRDFGLPPSKILFNIRMKEAEKLLTTTTEKIQTICRLVGMSNVKHFSVAFKRHFGVTPRAYRKGESGDLAAAGR